MNRTFIIAAPLMTALLVSTTVARAEHQRTPAKTEKPAAARLTADQAYKANCTRCHAELPKINARAQKTILMHMRVRANIPADEARDILKYLTR